MRALERLEPMCAACGQKLPRPSDLPEPGMGYKHDAPRFAAWRERWARGTWTLEYGAPFGGKATWRYSGALTDRHAVTCLDCGTPNEARFYREQS